MSKVKTFSRVYPSSHPKKGQLTYFVEKIHYSIWSGVSDEYIDMIDFIRSANKDRSLINQFIDSLDTETRFEPKHHTIRAGHLFKVGDKFSPRVWSGKPYQSKQIIIAPEIEVKKVWNFKISTGCFSINGRTYSGITEGDHELLEKISKNDGLNKSDLVAWFDFSKYFDGQIICWNDELDY